MPDHSARNFRMFLYQKDDVAWNVRAMIKGDLQLNLISIALRIFIEIVSDEIYISSKNNIKLNAICKYDLGQLLLTSKHHRRSIIPTLLHHIEQRDFNNKPWSRLLTNFSNSRFLHCKIFYEIEKKTKMTLFDGTFIISTDRDPQYETAVFIADQGNAYLYT